MAQEIHIPSAANVAPAPATLTFYLYRHTLESLENLAARLSATSRASFETRCALTHLGVCNQSVSIWFISQTEQTPHLPKLTSHSICLGPQVLSLPAFNLQFEHFYLCILHLAFPIPHFPCPLLSCEKRKTQISRELPYAQPCAGTGEIHRPAACSTASSLVYTNKT